jgi:CRISPR system Cascade subunit CasA
MFLTQLAAIALHRARVTDPPLDEGAWRGLLLAVTDGSHEPWCLVVEDLTMPAFFQPPVPEGTLDGWKTQTSPDDIDVLVTAKAHDVKTSLIAGHDVEAWIYALVTLQTMQGYPGRGYTGIARMKGGYGNRPRVGLAPDQGLGGRFLRDLTVLREVRPTLIERGLSDGGIGLLWTQPWDGRASLGLNELAPHFIEVCWRVRCLSDAGRVLCRYTTTENRRSVPEKDDGDVGDPWAPIERERGGMLTVGSRGFHYALLCRLLFENDFEPAAAQRLRVGDPDPVLFVAAALARGQGRTEGLHERVLEIAGAIRGRLAQPDTRAMLGRRAEERVAATERMQRMVLYPALRQLGPGVGTEFYGTEFDQRVDVMFFDRLFATLNDSDNDARLAWERELNHLAEEELERAISRCALPSARRYKVVSAAERKFAGCLRKNFPDIQAERPQPEGAPA